MEIKLRIEGMSCEHCVARVKKALEALPGVESAAVDLKSKSALVVGAALDQAAMESAVAEAGYEASAF